MFNPLELPGKLLNIFYVVAGVLVVYFIYSTVSGFLDRNKQDANVRGQLEVVVGTVEASNEQLKKAIDDQKKANDITQGTVSQVVEAHQQNIASKDTSHKRVEEKVVDINKEYSKLISQTTDPVQIDRVTKAKEIEVSKLRITALWINFCKYESQEPECKEITL